MLHAMITLQTLPDEIIQRLSNSGQLQAPYLADEPPTSVQQALPRVAELVVSSLAELASRPDDRDRLWQQTQQAASAPADASALVKSVLDDRYHGTVHGVVSASGLRATAVSELLEAATMAALAILGKLGAERRWDAQQLAQWLRPHQAEPVALQATAPTATVVAPATSWFAKRSNMLLLAVSFIAVGELGYILGQRSVETVEPIATTVPADASTPSGGAYTAIPVANLAPAIRPASSTSLPVPVVLKLKNGLRQVIGASSTESKLYQFLIDPAREVDTESAPQEWIGFDRIYFDTNKATLTNESLWQLSNVASILKRFPTAKIKLGGYTDNTGAAFRNLQLSKARAEAAREALVSLGVPADRLAAVGYGQLDNIASNDTEEGRAVNRRVSMQVTQK